MAQKSEKVVANKPTRTRKTPVAPRRTASAATRTAAKSETSVSVMPYTESQIRERAYYIYLERRGAVGDPVTDWYRAERELNGAVGSPRT
jgi:hypothetical protein